jgi:hypothetical protein
VKIAQCESARDIAYHVLKRSRCYEEMSQADQDNGKLVYDEALAGCGKRQLNLSKHKRARS